MQNLDSVSEAVVPAAPLAIAEVDLVSKEVAMESSAPAQASDSTEASSRSVYADADAEQQKQGTGSPSDAGSSTTMPGSTEALVAMAAADEWRRRAQQLTETITRVGSALKRFSKIPNRAIFYDLHPYFADAHAVLLVVRHYINWLGI